MAVLFSFVRYPSSPHKWERNSRNVKRKYALNFLVSLHFFCFSNKRSREVSSTALSSFHTFGLHLGNNLYPTSRRTIIRAAYASNHSGKTYAVTLFQSVCQRPSMHSASAPAAYIRKTSLRSRSLLLSLSFPVHT